METTTIALAYCIDNLPVAEGIEKALSSTPYTFTHHYCKKSQEQVSLAEQLQHHDDPIILLVSDNYLRSLNCMDRALKLIQVKSSSILPIVVNGRKFDDQSNQYVEVPTRFEKIGDIIPYINYWQNQYLDLRTQRKSIESEEGFDKSAFSEHLRTLRQVSSEASEFLRVLRNMQHFTFDEFKADHFEVLFDFLEDEEAWEAFKASTPSVEVAIEHPPTTDQDEGSEADEMPDLSEIPGIELIEGSENITKIIQNKMNDLNIEPVPLPEEEDFEEDEEEIEEEEVMEENQPEMKEDFEEEEEEENDDDAEEVQDIDQEVEESPNPEDLFEQLEEEENDDDIFDNLEADKELGGPASSKDDIEEEHAPDTDPSPQIFETPDDTSEELEEEESEEEGPFEDPEEAPAPLNLDELFDQAQADQETEEVEEDMLQLSSEDEEEQTREMIEQAFSLVNSGQLEDGINYMDQATRTFPDNTDIKYHFALMLAQSTSDFSSAIEQLNDLLEIDPDHIEANFLMGELAEIQEHYKAASKYYTKVTELDSSFQDVYARLGIVAMSMQEPKPEKAYKYFRKAYKNNKNNIDALYQLALLSNEVKEKPKKAIKLLKKTLEMNPEHPFANYDLALLYYQLDNKLDARFYYQKAIEINPELKTEENDLAFGNTFESISRKKPMKAFASSTPEETIEETVEEESVDETDALEALKNNIKKLEALLAEKTEEAKVQKKVDKTIFITGASSGIGRATARVFAKEGYRLILNGRRLERLEALEQELIEQYQSDILLLPFDVSNVEAVQNAVNSLPEQWQSIDILLNNAGKAKGFSPIHEGELRHWEEMIDVNLKGLLYLTRAIAPAMVSNGTGHIMNICSTAGKEVYPNGNVYCATKFAVDALTKAMRIDLHQHNIRVSQISPGHVEETEFALVRFDGDANRSKIYEDFLPLTSGDVAETIFFIASRPAHVNIQDVLMMGTQQASSNFINRSGRQGNEEEE